MGPSTSAAREVFTTSRPMPDRKIICADRLAPVEIADLAGTVLAAGDGGVEKHGLAAGFFYARVVLPDGAHDQELVAVAAGELERVKLDAPDYSLPAPLERGASSAS